MSVPPRTPAELARVAAAVELRRLAEAFHQGEHPLEELQQLTRSLGAEADRLAGNPVRERRMDRFTSYAEIPTPADGEWFPNSIDRPISGDGHPWSVPLDVRRVGDRAVTEVTLGQIYQGAPGRSHGGYVAAIYDDLLGFLLMLAETIAFTAYLKVSYQAGTPIGTPLRFEAWIERVEGRKLFLAGQCHADDEIVTTCEGLFIDAAGFFETAG